MTQTKWKIDREHILRKLWMSLRSDKSWQVQEMFSISTAKADTQQTLNFNSIHSTLLDVLMIDLISAGRLMRWYDQKSTLWIHSPMLWTWFEKKKGSHRLTALGRGICFRVLVSIFPLDTIDCSLGWCYCKLMPVNRAVFMHVIRHWNKVSDHASGCNWWFEEEQLSD